MSIIIVTMSIIIVTISIIIVQILFNSCFELIAYELQIASWTIKIYDNYYYSLLCVCTSSLASGTVASQMTVPPFAWRGLINTNNLYPWNVNCLCNNEMKTKTKCLQTTALILPDNSKHNT